MNCRVAPSEYRAWINMKQRCFDTKVPAYKNYGGRGITVCAEWKHDFFAFFAHVGPRPSKGHSIDRFPNNDGNYEPGNVRWATRSEQARNKRKPVRVKKAARKPVRVKKAAPKPARKPRAFQVIAQLLAAPSVRDSINKLRLEQSHV